MITEQMGDGAGRRAIGSQRKWAGLPVSPPAQCPWGSPHPLVTVRLFELLPSGPPVSRYWCLQHTSPSKVTHIWDSGYTVPGMIREF